MTASAGSWSILRKKRIRDEQDPHKYWKKRNRNEQDPHKYWKKRIRNEQDPQIYRKRSTGMKESI
ncbi:MAG: hypothetical protein K6B28_13185 [Lachnospiraceae bacterium]|nr:hypothetical protein [Lachnospiraceae bacterium]